MAFSSASVFRVRGGIWLQHRGFYLELEKHAALRVVGQSLGLAFWGSLDMSSMRADGRNSAHFSLLFPPSCVGRSSGSWFSVLLASSLPFLRMTLKATVTYRSGVQACLHTAVAFGVPS